MLRHTLVEIRDWLGDGVSALADPQAALCRRGLPPDARLELALVLTVAPASAAMSEWLSRERGDDCDEAGTVRKLGLLDWPIYGFLAWKLSAMLFNRDDEDRS